MRQAHPSWRGILPSIVWHVCVCDLETSSMKRPWSTLGCCARDKKISWGYAENKDYYELYPHTICNKGLLCPCTLLIHKSLPWTDASFSVMKQMRKTEDTQSQMCCFSPPNLVQHLWGNSINIEPNGRRNACWWPLCRVIICWAILTKTWTYRRTSVKKKKKIPLQNYTQFHSAVLRLCHPRTDGVKTYNRIRT